MLKLNNRQKTIIEYITKNKQASNKEIVNYFADQGEKTSRFSVVRDLDFFKGWSHR